MFKTAPKTHTKAARALMPGRYVEPSPRLGGTRTWAPPWSGKAQAHVSRGEYRANAERYMLDPHKRHPNSKPRPWIRRPVEAKSAKGAS